MSGDFTNVTTWGDVVSTSDVSGLVKVHLPEAAHCVSFNACSSLIV